MHRLIAPARNRRTALAALTAMLTIGGLLLATPAQAATELIGNGTFTDGYDPWIPYGVVDGSARITDGALCVDVPGGTAATWDSGIELDGLSAVAGTVYQLSFTAKASEAVSIVAHFIHNEADWEAGAQGQPLLGVGFARYSYRGVMPVDTSVASVVFELGGHASAYTFCLDDVGLLAGAEIPPYRPDTGPRVRVNQIGYLPGGPKTATLVTERTAPVEWTLRDAGGATVARGRSGMPGADPTSGLNTAVIDFGSVRRQGAGFTLTADGDTSYPFPISDTIYQQLRADSKLFFYTQRSGTPILASIAGAGYGRAAGHVGIAPNRGDTAVGCQQPAAASDGWTCTGTRDVGGGWYDAGDHGKYVVNGGIAVAQLLGEYERSLHALSGQPKRLADGTLRLPERANGVPDVLDEARWELEWMLKMQVPDGQQYPGMAYHKVHDDAWTGMPLDPAADPQPRSLHRPSTAATLNLAAAAAQGARLYPRYDPGFAARLRSAATRAYAAARLHPDLYAPASDGAGGGTFADTDVSDEFYWAAAELYLTTGERRYLDDLTASPWATGDVFGVDGFYWRDTAALGRLDLATVASAVPDRRAIQRSVLAGADRVLAVQRAQAFGQPYAPRDGFVWGSNLQVLNNLVLLGTAYDLSSAAKYRDAVLTGADYVFGRNGLNVSYVTGYGTVYSHNQTSRMYAHQLDPNLPRPPAGSLAGGPDSHLDDPAAASTLVGCVGQMCYLDDINSWSTNEICVSWNSALSWVSSFLDDAGRTAHRP